ncbi:hypothetical protein PGT21_030700 [Puccinia graminis f. sp. tritici]|uniref:Uncharacterized protein n=1 Tax=Puccinia graminis f. sp. tritici TaxID=56615 RepID=A0A5B0MN20_PUCGR|nr:hypothetical protein PGT21_030700 [Puccinia graminis f. sp. tritici]
MPRSIILDSRAPSDPEHYTSSGTAPQAEQTHLAMQSSSPQSQYVRPNDGGAESHQSRIHFHQKPPHASSENQLIGSHYDSNLNSASKAKGFHTSHSTRRSPSQANETQRFSPYSNPKKLGVCLPKLSTSFNNPSDKFTKPRKRTVIIKPKYPKYEGLSNFAAPRDLVSDIIPGSRTINLDKSSPPSSKSVPCLTPEKMSPKDYLNSIVTDDGQTESSCVPIDFLKRLDFDEWDQRKDNLLQMVEDRKTFFLQNGFAETSGKPFLPDEQAIDKKPIPNRWVWYMHLSTEYDKAKSTRVPAGGPAGYLKYGWDRLGVAGKQPYQELADIYSAQRLKFMAEHGIVEDSTKKKPKQSDKPKARNRSSQDVFAGGDKHHQIDGCFMDEPLSPRSRMARAIDKGISSNLPHLQPNSPFVPLQPILQPNLFYEQFSQFSHEKPPCDYADGTSETFEMTKAPGYSSYLQSPELMSCGFSPLGYEASSYSHRYNSDSTADQLGTPIGYPSSPTEYPFACNSNSAFPYQATSEFQTWSTLSPESINSGRSETVGVFPPSCMNNSTLDPAASYSSLAPANGFLEPLNRHEIDFNVLHPGINY